MAMSSCVLCGRSLLLSALFAARVEECRLRLYGLIRQDMHSICYGIECAPSSVSDVDRYVIIRTLLDYIFNILPVLIRQSLSYSRIFRNCMEPEGSLPCSQKEDSCEHGNEPSDSLS
jgi:hypothetical protein